MFGCACCGESTHKHSHFPSDWIFNLSARLHATLAVAGPLVDLQRRPPHKPCRFGCAPVGTTETLFWSCCVCVSSWLAGCCCAAVVRCRLARPASPPTGTRRPPPRTRRCTSHAQRLLLCPAHHDAPAAPPPRRRSQPPTPRSRLSPGDQIRVGSPTGMVRTHDFFSSLPFPLPARWPTQNPTPTPARTSKSGLPSAPCLCLTLPRSSLLSPGTSPNNVRCPKISDYRLVILSKDALRSAFNRCCESPSTEKQPTGIAWSA